MATRFRLSALNNWTSIFLAAVERGGNALPHPGTLFAILAGVIIVVSGIAARTGLEAVHPGTGETIQPISLLNVAGLHRPEALLRLIGREDLLGPEGIERSAFTEPGAFLDEVEASFLAWLLQRGKREVVDEMQSRRILAGLLQTTEDLLEDEHYRSRGVWETVDHPATGPIEYPGRQLVLSETPKARATRAPLLSEHTAEVLVDELGADLGLTHADLPRLRAEGVV